MAGSLVNPIRYTSRDFISILSDINSDPNLADKEDWWKKVWAGIGDNLSMHLNAGFNNSYLRTAFTRRAVADILSRNNFQLTPQAAGNGNIILYIKQGTIFPFTLSQTDMAAMTQGSASSGSMRFESRLSSVSVTAYSENPTANVGAGPGAAGTLTVARAYTTGERVVFTATTGGLPSGLSLNTNYYVIAINSTTIQLASSIANAYGSVPITFTTAGTGAQTMGLYSVQVAMYQQTSVAQYSVGSGDGVTQWQQFPLNDVNVLQDTLVVTINGENWTRVTNPIYNTGTDKVFRLYYNNDQSAYIEFGDGTYGAVAPNFEVMVSYAFGGGSATNIPIANMINSYAGTNSNIDGCSNPKGFSGGSDPMSISQAKEQGPILTAIQQRFMSAQDGESLMLAYGGISLALVQPNYFGPNSAQLVAIATGGGNPSGTLQTDLISYLTPLTLFGAALLAFVDATLVSVSPAIAVHLNTGYTFSTEELYVQVAAQLFFTERSQEILSYYIDKKLASTVSLINSIWGYSFGTSDYTVLGNLLDYMNRVGARSFGEYITVDQFTTFVESNIPSVNYVTISSPSFPMTLGATSITTLGAVPVVTQI